MSKSISKRTAIAAAALAGAALMVGTGGVQAAPFLQIMAQPGSEEVTGDPGGTNYNVGPGTLNGPGLPSAGGGWPNTTPKPAPNGNGFAADPSFPGVGMTGFHTSYLWLSEDANVTFQFMGKGNATQSNSFLVNGIELFRGNTTTACPMLGGLAPTCDKLTGGPLAQNQYTFFFDVADGGGYVPFQYIADIPGNRVTLSNDGSGNFDPHTANQPGYMLGVDPYQATGPYQTRGNVVYAGLSDRPAAGDHDFQDMGVRISVPEPGGVALVLAALLGLTITQRRGKRS